MLQVQTFSKCEAQGKITSYCEHLMVDHETKKKSRCWLENLTEKENVLYVFWKLLRRPSRENFADWPLIGSRRLKTEKSLGRLTRWPLPALPISGTFDSSIWFKVFLQPLGVEGLRQVWFFLVILTLYSLLSPWSLTEHFPCFISSFELLFPHPSFNNYSIQKNWM